MNKTVTINIGRNHYGGHHFFSLGSKISLGSHWIGKQRIKNKQTVCRLRKKKYSPPHLLINNIRKDEGSTTLTVKPINF